MEFLTQVENPNPWWYAHLWLRNYYYLSRDFVYYSERYDKHLTVPHGLYDGATWAFDRKPKNGNAPAWLIHDAICQQKTPRWDDSTPIDSETAAQVLADQLVENGHSIAAKTWKRATKWFGCVNTRVND